MSTSTVVLDFILSRIEEGNLVVTWPDGRVHVFDADRPGATAVLNVNDDAALLRAIVRAGSVGFAGAYIDGVWDTPDLAGLLELASRTIDIRQERTFGSAVMGAARRLWQERPSWLWRSPIAEIGEHYDLGNDFYAAWLDETMTYSSALFAGESTSLEEAQRRKYDALCRLADVQPGDRVLEIGCGWGGFAEHAASRYGAHVTGVTLSVEMARFARKRLADAGLSDVTSIDVRDFRDVTGTYDKVVSIEMIESISADQWAELFGTIARVLRPGGRLAMQAITIDPRYHDQLTRREDFIKAYIFPGGALPTIPLLEDLTRDAGLTWEVVTTHGPDYAATLGRWRASFEAAWAGIIDADPSFDERFHRMWRYYLAYCEAGFRTGRIDGVQVGAVKPA